MAKKDPPVVLSNSLLRKDGPRRSQLANAAAILDVSYGDAFLYWARWLQFRTKNAFDRVTPENLDQQATHLRLMARDVDEIVSHAGFADAMCKIGWLQEVDGMIFSSAEAIVVQQKNDEARERRRRQNRIKGGRHRSGPPVGLGAMVRNRRSRVAN